MVTEPPEGLSAKDRKNVTEGEESETQAERATPNNSDRRALRPAIVELIREALEQYRAHNPAFIERWFPAIAQRGSVDYDDIERMSPDQADAMRYALAQSFRYLRRQDDQARGRSRSQLLNEGSDDEPSQHLVKARQYAEALHELCAIFGMADPLEG